MGPILVGGCPRSGTTLLRVMLDSHREITCPPEAKLVARVAQQWESTHGAASPHLSAQLGVHDTVVARAYGGVIRAVLEDVRRRAGTRWVAEKTPNNVLFFPHLLHMMPDSPLVHVVRDGRDVVASLLRQEWTALGTGAPLAHTQTPEAAARHWALCVGQGRLAEQSAPGRVHTVRYEDLVRAPEPTLRALFEALRLPFDPRMLHHHTQPHTLPATEATTADVQRPVHTGAVGRWRAALDRRARAIVQAVAGTALAQWGYAADGAWVDEA